jgi:serine/threonine protein kinase
MLTATELEVEEDGVYERMRPLGRGSFGTVSLVKDSRDGKLYALKAVKYDANQKEFKDRALKVGSPLNITFCLTSR